MGIAIETRGVHHIALRSTDLARSRRFYVDTLGFPLALEGPGLFLVLAGQTAVAVRGPEAATPAGDVFNPFRAGLDHVALACAGKRELHRVASALAAASIENTGVKLDSALNREYVAFKDPDRIAWELYMAPDLSVQAVEAYFDGLRGGSVETIPLAPAVSFESPLTARLHGADAVRDFLRGALPLIRGVRVLDVVSHGDMVGARIELETTFGTIPAFDWFRVADGLIVEVRAYFDPAPVVSSATGRV